MMCIEAGISKSDSSSGKYMSRLLRKVTNN